MMINKDNQKWLKIEAHCFGLINLLSEGKLDAKTRPTLTGDVNFKKIIDDRNKQIFDKPDNCLKRSKKDLKRKKERQHQRRMKMSVYT